MQKIKYNGELYNYRQIGQKVIKYIRPVNHSARAFRMWLDKMPLHLTCSSFGLPFEHELKRMVRINRKYGAVR